MHAERLGGVAPVTFLNHSEGARIFPRRSFVRQLIRDLEAFKVAGGEEQGSQPSNTHIGEVTVEGGAGCKAGTTLCSWICAPRALRGADVRRHSQNDLNVQRAVLFRLDGERHGCGIRLFDLGKTGTAH
eukprot:2953617-Prymnesium_polylepis.1